MCVYAIFHGNLIIVEAYLMFLKTIQHTREQRYGKSNLIYTYAATGICQA